MALKFILVMMMMMIVVKNVICDDIISEVNLSNSSCYKPKKPSNYRRSLRIVGGLDAEEGETPYMAALIRNEAVICGASIISERFLILAAHCVCNNQNFVINPTQLKVFIGLRQISDVKLFENNHLNDDEISSSVNEVFIDEIIIHPGYSCGRKKENDIALLYLQKAIKFNEKIQPLCLSTEKSFSEMATVSGWGLTHESYSIGLKPNILQSASVPVWDNEECQSSYRNLKKSNKISENQMCAGGRDGGIDSCWMDSGGPLVSKSDGKLVGIVSTGVGCARKGLPGIYTRLSQYVNWINSQVMF